MKLTLKNVRLAFPKLFVAQSVNGGAPTFGGSFILTPDHPQIAELKKAMDQVGQEKWGAQWPQVKKAIAAKDGFCLHDGDLKAQYEGYEGNLYVSANSKTRPTVVDRDRTPLVESDGKPYSGCYVNVSVDIWAQDRSDGKRINAALRGVQFFKDGESFAGGGVASSDEFDDLSAETDDVADLV